jgi:hypothetical protein
VPVDDGAVDADGLRDVLDLRVADTAFVEQPAGGGEDLLPAGRPPVGGCHAASVDPGFAVEVNCRAWHVG